ncbi:MAG TPA: antibiotic biosynthesis monooxygenase [Gemmatimonadales bacterium]|nr:antibiotic biosynthesis monooxygenase [Gemmatimonadales bacterium]
MPITSFATFTIKPGQVPGALRLIAAVKRQAEREQPGTLVYLVHRVLDAKGKPTRQLYFYERYRGQAALNAHLASSSWQKVLKEWSRYFEGTPVPGKGLSFFGVERIAAFARPGAIPSARARRTA